MFLLILYNFLYENNTLYEFFFKNIFFQYLIAQFREIFLMELDKRPKLNKFETYRQN